MGAKEAEKDLTVLGKPGLFMSGLLVSAWPFSRLRQMWMLLKYLCFYHKNTHRRVPSSLRI
jgi:hypothetical protein